MQYQITINIDPADVSTIINSGQLITVCKKFINPYISVVRSATPNNLASTNVLDLAWLAIQPFQQNSIQWQDQYSVYATGNAICAGNVIQINAISAAQVGLNYAFTSTGFTATPASDMPKYYNILNQQTTLTNFGLAQAATVNGTTLSATPINCVTALNNQEANFLTSETVSLFLSNTQANASFIPRIPASSLQLGLNSQTPSATVGFNSTTNSFYLISNQ